MTKQNVVVSEVKCMAISVPISNQSLFSSSIPKPILASPSGCITVSRNKILKLENGSGSGGSRISSWVDSMRASSPSRMKSSVSLSVTEEEQSSWNVSPETECCFVLCYSFFFFFGFLIGFQV